jgi:YD repeat-containing protein
VRHAPPPVDGCPLEAAMFEPFAHDLFAGCPPAPLPRGVTCPAGCDLPCRGRLVEDGARAEIRYHYMRDRLAMVQRAGGYQSDLFCTFDDAGIRCGITSDGPRVAYFDEHGRIDRLDLLGKSWDVTYGRFVTTAGGAHHVSTNVDAIVENDLDGEHRRFEFLYGVLGRLTVASFAGPETQTTSSYEYDDRGRLAREVTREGPRIYRYDRGGSLASIFAPGTRTTSYFDYDTRGRVIRVVTERSGHRSERTYEYCR